MNVSSSWELLVLGGTVLTMEPGLAPIENGAVAISNGKIVAVGPAEAMLEVAPTGELLNASGCIIMPGFVNTHSHLPMTLLRGLADDLKLRSWLEDHIWPAEKKHMNRGTVRLGTLLAAAEQLLAGVTTTTDMYFFDDEVAAALVTAGMRGVVGESLIDLPTPRCKTPEEMAEKQIELIEKYQDHPLIYPSVAAHAPYTVSAANLVKEAEIADQYGVPLQIHLSESKWEVENILKDKGVSPVRYLTDLGILTETTIAAHCVHVSEEDIELLREFEVGVAHNPASNFKLSSGIAPIAAMIESGIKVSIGTDGAASNNSLDMLRDAQLATFMQKAVTGNPEVMPANQVLEIMTSGGARVLGLDKKIGMLKEGMEADLICVATDGPHATPLYDPYSHMINAARSSDVRHVLVNGKVVVRDRQLETLDLEEIQTQANEVAERIRG